MQAANDCANRSFSEQTIHRETDESSGYSAKAYLVIPSVSSSIDKHCFYLKKRRLFIAIFVFLIDGNISVQETIGRSKLEDQSITPVRSECSKVQTNQLIVKPSY